MEDDVTEDEFRKLVQMATSNLARAHAAAMHPLVLAAHNARDEDKSTFMAILMAAEINLCGGVLVSTSFNLLQDTAVVREVTSTAIIPQLTSAMEEAHNAVAEGAVLPAMLNLATGKAEPFDFRNHLSRPDSGRASEIGGDT